MSRTIKKVLLDFERMEFPYTGFYYANLYYGKQLLKIAPPNYHFTIYVKDEQFGIFGNDVAYENRKTYSNTKSNKVAEWMYRLYRERMRPKFAIIHITDQHSSFQPRDPLAKVVLTVHDLNYLVEVNDPEELERQSLHHQRMLDKADVIVCISNFVKQCVVENLDVKGKPIHVVYQGCRIEDLPDVHEPVYKPSRPFLFAISNLLPKKNFHTLPCLLRDNNYELVISGITEHESQRKYVKVIQEQARIHGVQDRVIITGPVSDNDRQWYYKNCTAFMFPSLAEGFGIPPLEAMHFGKPVFASTCTSVPEICGDAAYYFNSFEPDAMIEVFNQGMKDFETFKPIEKIKQRYAFFSWEKTVNGYLAVYDTL